MAKNIENGVKKVSLYDYKTILYMQVGLIATIVAWVATLILFITGDADSGRLILYLSLGFTIMMVLVVFSYKYCLIDKNKIVVKNLIMKTYVLRWDDIDHIELRLFVCEETITGAIGRELREYYVLFSKTKKEIDNNYYSNKPGVPLRIPFTGEMRNIIAKYYHGAIIDKREFGGLDSFKF